LALIGFVAKLDATGRTLLFGAMLLSSLRQNTMHHYRARHAIRGLISVLLGALCVHGQRKTGSPLDHLPPNIEVLTQFGERPDISPDNKRIAFMAKSFGDAFVMDLDKRVIRCLTCSVPGAAFLRVMHLSTGDYLLFGPEQVDRADIQTSRHRDNHLVVSEQEAGIQAHQAQPDDQ
jgi:hypothetical protein